MTAFTVSSVEGTVISSIKKCQHEQTKASVKSDVFSVNSIAFGAQSHSNFVQT